ncbi:MAG TPA: hypothetical protein VGF99_21905, partial [Myxococcota bacterium]
SGDCLSGTMLINAGNANAGPPMYGQFVVWSTQRNSLLAPSVLDATGSSPKELTFTSGSIEQVAGSCSASVGTRGGWRVEVTNAASVGLPVSPPFSTPLDIR